MFSPDGRWIAYASDETGRGEIYVRPFPASTPGKWLVSKGATSYGAPAWRRDGKELLYLAPDGSVRELDTGTKAPGRYNISWDGTDAAGAAAPEGRYHWNVSATDDLGRASSHDRPFTLDRTLGFLNVSTGARRIEFTLTRDARIRATIETRFGGILRTVAASSRAAGTVSVSWNGRDGRGKRVRRGSYVVRVAATSPVGLSELRKTFAIRR